MDAHLKSVNYYRYIVDFIFGCAQMGNEYLNNKSFEATIKSFQHYKKQKAKLALVIADLQETHDRRQLKYKDDEKKLFLDQVKKDYVEVCKHFEVFQNQLAAAFYILAENIANYANYAGVEVDDAIQESVLICFEKIDRFDPRKGKAFNYFSTLEINSARQLYRSAKNYGELKKRYGSILQSKIECAIMRKLTPIFDESRFGQGTNE